MLSSSRGGPFSYTFFPSLNFFISLFQEPLLPVIICWPLSPPLLACFAIPFFSCCVAKLRFPNTMLFLVFPLVSHYVPNTLFYFLPWCTYRPPAHTVPFPLDRGFLFGFFSVRLLSPKNFEFRAPSRTFRHHIPPTCPAPPPQHISDAVTVAPLLSCILVSLSILFYFKRTTRSASLSLNERCEKSWAPSTPIVRRRPPPCLKPFFHPLHDLQGPPRSVSPYFPQILGSVPQMNTLLPPATLCKDRSYFDDRAF